MSETVWATAEDRAALRETVRRFAREVVRPLSLKIEAAGEPVPLDLMRQMATLGLACVDVPVSYGGQGLDTVTSAALVEEMAYGWFSAATYVVNMAVRPIVLSGTEAQKQRYLPPVCRGETIAAIGLTEPDTGSDASSIKTRARRDGDSYVINGRKIFITNGGRADFVILFARTADADRGKGISMFIVEKGTPGFSVGQHFRTLGHQANPIVELLFDDCRVPASALLGPEGDAFRHIQEGFAHTRAVYGARCVGVAQAAVDYALQHATQRRQFGETIASFQGIRFKVADIVTRIEAARSLTYNACALVDADSPDAQVAASMAKNFSSNVATEATSEAIQLMGGHGYTCDHPVERFYREAKLFEIGDGTCEVLRLLISRFANKKAAAGASARLP